MKTNSERLNPKVSHYRGYFYNDRFWEYLLSTLLFENFNINHNGTEPQLFKKNITSSYIQSSFRRA